MNQLDPELKRLTRWARQPETPSPELPPFGFTVRVAALGREELLLAEPAWGHWLRWGAASASLIVVVSGLVFWSSQRRPATNAYNIAPAYSFAAKSIVP